MALAAPSVVTTLAGSALAGLGAATLIPAVMHTADELPHLPAGVGPTAVSWLLRFGFLVSPTVIGVVADITSLRVALLSVVVAGAGALLLAGTSKHGTPHRPLDEGLLHDQVTTTPPSWLRSAA